MCHISIFIIIIVFILYLISSGDARPLLVIIAALIYIAQPKHTCRTPTYVYVEYTSPEPVKSIEPEPEPEPEPVINACWRDELEAAEKKMWY